jgi:hypothetical protein
MSVRSRFHDLEPEHCEAMPSSQARVQVRPLTIVLVLLALAFAAAGVVYFTTEAKSLPSFFPGHDASLATKHIKHGLAMVTLAIVSLIGAWFTTKPPDAA